MNHVNAAGQLSLKRQLSLKPPAKADHVVKREREQREDRANVTKLMARALADPMPFVSQTWASHEEAQAYLWLSEET